MPESKPFTPTQERWLHTLAKPMSAANTWIYRLTGGRVGGTWLRGAPILLLTTRGRKSGEPRTAPVLYLEDGDNLVVVASKAGFSRHPVWYLNLVAFPDAEVQLRSEQRKVRSRRASAEEKAALWPRLVEMYRDFGDYQARTPRDIPVVILEPH